MITTPQLRWALRVQEQYSDLSADVAEYLDAVYTLNLEKNQICIDQLVHCIGVMNSVGVQPVLLKGAAVIAAGLYPTNGERMISDLDILVPAAKLPEIIKKMVGAGYQPFLEAGIELPNPIGFEREDHHYVPLVSKDWPVAIELHVHPVLLPFDKLLSSEEVFEGAKTLNWYGTNCLLPSPTHLVVHNVIHAFIVDTQLSLHRFSIRQLFEFVLMSNIFGNQIDWQAISSRFKTFGYGKSLRQYVALANVCFNFITPQEIDMSNHRRFQIALYIMRQNIETSVLDKIINIISPISSSLAKLRRSPSRIRRILKAGFYSRFIKNMKL